MDGRAVAMTPLPRPRPTSPECPYCGERRQTEDDGVMGFCATCGRIWKLAPVVHPPTKKGGL